MQINDYFIRGDLKGAIEYMRCHGEYREVLPLYTSLFEDGRYLTYDAPEILNKMLLPYQVYYRDIFYCGISEPTAAQKLLDALRELAGEPAAGGALLRERLTDICEQNGYHALFGKTQGLYGPYIWKDTVPVSYTVELPDSTAEYTVNILKNFLFRSFMAYLTFGEFGTGGWASEDGTINCIEQAYDFGSEQFLVSLLKHEAQHTADMKRYPGITPAELEYRAKLVELHYSQNTGLLQKLISEAAENKPEDSHATANHLIKCAFPDTEELELPEIQERALELLRHIYPICRVPVTPRQIITYHGGVCQSLRTSFANCMTCGNTN